MPVRFIRSRTRAVRFAVLAPCGLMCLLPALAVQAQAPGQDAAENAQNPSFVIVRTVHPRVAYRGIPIGDHPIHAEAVTFPARVFDGVLDGVMGSVVGDEALGERGSVNTAIGAMQPLLERGAAPLAPTLAGQRGSGSTPLGLSATAGAVGAVGDVTRGLGARITNALAPVLGAGQPGGGP